MEPAQIRIVDVAPSHCSGCFQAKPQEVHIDFGAAWDGPVLPALDGAIGVNAVSIDDLVLCRQCVEQAAKLLGLVQPDEVKAERDLLRQGNVRLVSKIRQRDQYIDALEKAIAARDESPGQPELDDLADEPALVQAAIATAPDVAISGGQATIPIVRDEPEPSIPPPAARRPKPKRRS